MAQLHAVIRRSLLSVVLIAVATLSGASACSGSGISESCSTDQPCSDGGICIDGSCFANLDGGNNPDITRPDGTSDVPLPDVDAVDTVDATPDADAVVTPDTDTVIVPDADADEIGTPDADAVVTPDSDAVTTPDADAVVSPDADAVVTPDTDAVTTPDSDAVVTPDADADADSDGPEVIAPYCGDQIVNGDEACDDGNEDDDDFCHNDCTLACGDGVLAPFETCDVALAPDEPGGCPLTCETSEACMVSTLVGEACDAACVTAPLSVCESGDGCCGDGCDALNDAECEPVCGNEVVEVGETCDPPSSCPLACDDGDPCTTEAFEGSADFCDVLCVPTEITACQPADGCCPAGCTFATDTDCEDTCGNGELDPGELCDPCPANCDDSDPCTTDLATGSASTCNLECEQVDIIAPKNADGCCPPGANALNDNDCSPKCGNEVVEPPETCDACAPCPAGNACTTWTMTGSAGGCDLVCTENTLTVCGGDPDGCCPIGCVSGNDPDCSAICGNNVVEPGETCDPPGSCPTKCNDDNPCTTDLLTGQASKCTGKCLNTPITAPKNGDLCCPPGATALTDNDCPSDCGNNIIEPPELCDPCAAGCDDGDECTLDTATGAAGTCDLVCTNAPITACALAADGCCPSGCNGANDGDCGPVGVSPASAVTTSSDCLTAGTSARLTVAVTLVDTAGAPLLGATVVMNATAGSFGAVSAEGNVYYAELTAPNASVLSSTVTVVANGVTLSTKPSVDVEAPLTGTALTSGGWGGCPADGNVRVKVVNAAGAAISGARVMVGNAPSTALQTSFTGTANGANHGTADASGIVRFHDLGSTLSSPVTVTAAAEGREYVTVFSVDASDFVLVLADVVDTTSKGVLNGALTNVPAPAGGNIELGIVFPDLAVETLATFNLNSLLADSECYNAGGIAGSLALPGNIFIPAQCALSIGVCLQSLPLHNFKSAPVPYGSRRMVGLRGAVPLSAITGGVASAIPQLVINGIGTVQKTVNAAGPTAQNIGITTNLTANVTCAIDKAPANSDVFCVTAGDWDSKASAALAPGEGQLMISGFKVGDAAGKTAAWNITGATSYPLTGDFANVEPVGAAIALYLDDAKTGIPAGTASGQSAIMDRSGTGFNGSGGTMNFKTFFPIRSLSRSGRTFNVSAMAAGSYPAPHYMRGLIQQRVSIPYSGCATNDESRRVLQPLWQIYAPPAATGWTLPTVPTDWPRAAAGGNFAGLVDPAATPADDLLQWQALTVYEGLKPSGIYDQREILDFRRNITHVSTNAQTF
ncbi:MAG: hypothetical protein R3F39_24705 [Myxococcota bacterium]